MFDIERFPTNAISKKMMKTVTASVYDRSYIAKWMYQVMGVEMEEAWRLAEEVRNQAFVETATWGISYWEYRYSIIPNEALSIEERRARIKRKRTQKYPMNPGKIEKYMFDSWDMTVDITEAYAPGTFLLAILKDDSNNLRAMLKDFREMKPSHLSWKLLYRIIGELIEYASADMNDEMSADVRFRLDDYYPWPTRTLNGNWRFHDCSRFNESWKLNGERKLNRQLSIPPGIPLNAHVDDFGVLGIKMRGVHDRTPIISMPLSGNWKLDKSYMLGSNPAPVDGGGHIHVRKRKLLDGGWYLNGGDKDLLDGSIYMDGRCRLNGGGTRLRVDEYDDLIDGDLVLSRVKKVIPHSLMFPKLDDTIDSLEDFIAIRRKTGILFDDAAARKIGLDGEAALNGSTILSENIMPMDFAGDLEIRQCKRLDGSWNIDAGDVLRVNGSWSFDGSLMLKERGNRFEIKRYSGKL